MAKNGPLATFRLGAVKASVWKNSDFFSVQLVRVFKDGEEYKETSSFNPGDIQNARDVLQRACDYIVSQ